MNDDLPVKEHWTDAELDDLVVKITALTASVCEMAADIRRASTAERWVRPEWVVAAGYNVTTRWLYHNQAIGFQKPGRRTLLLSLSGVIRLLGPAPGPRDGEE